MFDLFTNAVTFLLAIVFAAVWGAHVFETTVLFRVWAEAPSTALPGFVATPYAKTLGRFWQALTPGLYVMSFIAPIVALLAGLQAHAAMAIAGLCGLIHLAMVVLIFLPTNVKLGFYSGKPASVDPQVIARLLSQWGRWNLVRLGVETAGLTAALLALKAS
jgi:hypothetical protein